jgi:sugar lactone lactonase YvrE
MLLEMVSKQAPFRVGLIACALAPLVAPPQLSSAGMDPEIHQPRFVLEWGKRGQGPGEFHFPIGIAVDNDGDVFISDFYNARVERFSPEGKLLSILPVEPNPGGMAIDRQGHLYLTHFSAMKQKEEPKPDRVTVYTRDGRLLRQWGTTGAGDGQFDYPGGIALGWEGRVYVADQTNHRVQVFDPSGKFLFKWGEYGTKPGQFGGNSSRKSRVGGPQFVTVDGQGNVYTTEGSTTRVQKFTADGKFLLTWGRDLDTTGQFGGSFLNNDKRGIRGAMGICFDDEGKLWVSAVSGRVQQFTSGGRYLQKLGTGQGSKPGEFIVPHALAADGRGHLYVVDSYNHRVQKFALHPERPGARVSQSRASEQPPE